VGPEGHGRDDHVHSRSGIDLEAGDGDARLVLTWFVELRAEGRVLWLPFAVASADGGVHWSSAPTELVSTASGTGDLPSDISGVAVGTRTLALASTGAPLWLLDEGAITLAPPDP